MRHRKRDVGENEMEAEIGGQRRRMGVLVWLRSERDSSITVSCRSVVMGGNNKLETAL